MAGGEPVAGAPGPAVDQWDLRRCSRNGRHNDRRRKASENRRVAYGGVDA
jgi:hypothetical protein